MKTRNSILTLLVVILISMTSCKTYQYPKHIIIGEEEKYEKRKLYNSIQYKYINGGLINDFNLSSTHKDYTYFTLDLKDLDDFIKTAKVLDIKNKNKTLKFRIYLSAEKDTITNIPYTTLTYSIISKKVNTTQKNANVQNRSRIQNSTIKTEEEKVVLSGNKVGTSGNPPKDIKI